MVFLLEAVTQPGPLTFRGDHVTDFPRLTMTKGDALGMRG